MLTHRALQDTVLTVGARLSDRGIGRHDRVALVLPGGAGTAIAILGIMSVAIVVPFHPGSTAHELTRDLERLQPALLVTDGTVRSPSRVAAGELSIPATSLAELLATGDGNATRLPCLTATEPEQIAAILHTSGTTGLPKRALRSHRSFVAAARAARQCTALTPRDVALLTSGLSTNSGLANLCAALLNGGSCVVTPGFDPAAYPRWLDDYQPTWTVSTSTELTMLLDAAAAAGCEAIAGPGSRLRVVRAGAQPMAPGVAARAERSLRALIFDGYGMTEASYITGSGPGPGDRRPGSAGPPLCSTLRILDGDGADLPPGEVGEIVIRGATLFSGYLDDPEANAAVFLPGGWFRTGDLGSSRRRWVSLCPRPPERADQSRRRKNRPGRGRSRASRPSGGDRRRHLRRARPPPGRGHRRRRRPRCGERGDATATARLAARPSQPLQGAPAYLDGREHSTNADRQSATRRAGPALARGRRMSGEPTLPESVQTIPAMLAFWAEQTPHAPALVVPGQPAISYAALWRRVRILAEALHRAGIGRHDRVVLLLPEGPVLTTALLGTMSAAIAVPLPASLTTPELSAALDGLHATAALITPEGAATTRDCLQRHGAAVSELADHGESAGIVLPGRGAPRPTLLPWPAAQDIAVVCQTSGTTGKAKRVPLTHHNLTQCGKNLRDEFGIRPSDRAPAIAPVTLSLGQTVLMQVLASGSSLIHPPPTDIGRQWEIIERERPTWMFAAPGYLELLARSLDRRRAGAEPGSLRFVLVTSAPISAATCEKLERRLGGRVCPRYSSSEAGAIAVTKPPPAPRAKPGSVGHPIQEVLIVDVDGTPVRPGSVGEIWVRGPRVFTGYLDDAGAAAAFLPEGWFRTGDAGYLDDDEFLFLTGRLNELINRGGEKIAPVEVDQVLIAHPAVSAAAAFGVPDELLGEDVVAAVVLKRGERLTPRALRRWMLDRLSPSKAPRRIWFVDALPLTLSGKVRRGALADQFLNREDRP